MILVKNFRVDFNSNVVDKCETSFFFFPLNSIFSKRCIFNKRSRALLATSHLYCPLSKFLTKLDLSQPSISKIH